MAPIPVNKAFALELTALRPGAGEWFNLRLFSEVGGPCCWLDQRGFDLSFSASGASLRTDGVEQALANGPTGTWMTIRFETNPALNAYRVFLDGVPLHSGALSEMVNLGTMMSIHSGGTGNQQGFQGCGANHVYLDTLKLQIQIQLLLDCRVRRHRHCGRHFLFWA